MDSQPRWLSRDTSDDFDWGEAFVIGVFAFMLFMAIFSLKFLAILIGIGAFIYYVF